jgi:hypothetical protein
MYSDNFVVLADIAQVAFGAGVELIKPSAVRERVADGTLNGNQIVVFGRYWGQELPLPRPPGATSGETRKYYVDWILAKIGPGGSTTDLTAIEVQTIDTTGNYSDQAQAFFAHQPFIDQRGRNPGYSDAGMNWENVNKRILPQIIYKGHVLRREEKCSKGLFFVCPKQVYAKIFDRLGGGLHQYHPSPGTISFRSYELSNQPNQAGIRSLQLYGQFTTTVDQVALAFTSPKNLPDQNVYEAAISNALNR